jgi:hypothetical protein
MSVSGNFTVPATLPKLLIFHSIRKNIGCKYGAVSENFTTAHISYNYLFFLLFLSECLTFSRINVRVFYSLPCYQNYFEGSSLHKRRINCLETTVSRLGFLLEKRLITTVLAEVFVRLASTLFHDPWFGKDPLCLAHGRSRYRTRPTAWHHFC